MEYYRQADLLRKGITKRLLKRLERMGQTKFLYTRYSDGHVEKAWRLPERLNAT